MANSRNNALEFSSVGSEAFTSGGSATGRRYGALQIINDTIFSNLVASNVESTGNLQGITIAAGTVLYGQFSALTITTGVVVAHKY
tara:strand:+ start:1041 stop:1298 length:258 start_codon:yes stop_codon:yes gene_type:complete